MKALRIMSSVAFISLAALALASTATAADLPSDEPGAVAPSTEPVASSALEPAAEGDCPLLQSESPVLQETALTPDVTWVHSGVDCTTTYNTVAAGCCAGNQKKSKLQSTHCCTVVGGRTCHTDTLSTWCSGTCPN